MNLTRHGLRIALAAAAVLVLASVGWAAIPGSDGVVWACYGNNEALRVIDKAAGETCRGTELGLLAAGGKAADADLLDGKNSTDFLPTSAWPRFVTVVDVYREQREVTLPANTTESVELACSRSDRTGSTPWTIDPAMSGGIEGLDATTHLRGSYAFPHDGWRWTLTTGASADTFSVQVTCLYHAS